MPACCGSGWVLPPDRFHPRAANLLPAVSTIFPRMTRPVSPTVAGSVGPLRRSVSRWEVAALVLVTLAVGLFGVLLGAIQWKYGAQQRHLVQLRRVEQWLSITRAFPPRGLDQREWSQALVGPHNALYNVLHHPKVIPTATVRALADHFDRTQAKGLGSLGELLGFIAYLEEICPNAKDYGPFGSLRMSYPAVKPVPFTPPPVVP